ncbi:conserved exported hypothetical protein [Candidatus Sulfopaludibacter sp. SbA3]|nr:conserved exported hypothetical protein [Candidatus Sulfopaludibacter sp. SbA3]
MSRLLFFLLAAATAFAADDPWAKVQALKSGTEIRVIKKGSTQPLIGKFDEADADRLLMVLKNEQVAIPKDQVDRLDYRPAGGRVTVTGKTTQNDPTAAQEPRAGMAHQPEGGGTTSTAGVNVGSRPDFEMLYRRPIGAPKK